MRILKEVEDRSPLRGVRAAIFNVGNTLFNSPAYFAEGRRKEIAAIARELNLDAERVVNLIRERKKSLSENLGRTATLTEAIGTLALSPTWWNRVRERCYRPEAWLRPDLRVIEVIRSLTTEFTLAAASNSPRNIVSRILGVTELRPHFRVVWGPEDGGAKHEPGYWVRLADRLALESRQCVSVGDREETDCSPAIAAGFGGAILVGGTEDLPKVAQYLLRRNA